MYFIRVDANDRIGIGHMMRCLCIAGALRRKGCESTFFVADKSSAALVADAGFGYVCLHSDYDHLDVESDKLLQLMRERRADNLLVDSYFVTESYLKKIRSVANVAYIDDINKFIYPCDLLIDYNIYADELDYPGRYKAAGLETSFALGLEYMPLRGSYLNIEKKPHEGLRVLITTGATDSYDVIGHILEKAVERGLDEKMELIAIVGQYNHNKDSLLARFDARKNIHLIDPQRDLVNLIASCDMAVTAGGTTVYEMCAGGLPCVMVTLADNQMRAALAFSSRGIIPYAGDVRTDMEGTMDRVISTLEEYAADADVRNAASFRMKKVVDGRGAERIAELLMNLHNAKVPQQRETDTDPDLPVTTG